MGVNPVIEIVGLTKSFGKLNVLNGIDLTVSEAEVVALIGPSGSGKSTFLRCINRLETPTSGQVKFKGELCTSENVNAIRREIGMVFQKPNPFPSMTIAENVLAGLKLAQLKVENKDDLLEECLERAGLWNEVKDRLNTHGGALSGGQQQRVALARALARSPKILLLDEPFSAIDAPTRQSLYKTLAQLRRDFSIPILLVTHDLREADLLADRITVIDQGVGLQTTPPKILFERPRNSRVAELVGINNKFEGIFTAGKLMWTGCERFFNVVDKGKIPPNTPVAWVIPADGLSLEVAQSNTSIEVVVEQVSTIGQIAVIQLQTTEGGQTIVWEASAAEVKRLALEANKKCHLEIDSNKIHIMPLRPINDPRRFSS